ncbi:hypothetical protein [Parapedobacter sp. 10938]|uniref:hypothetical protein n=1 Tax=Parapedobacter flavus TaxID=3110225 RepID=UPI002DBDFBCC|nr:hypothetical protein [Parapedobacter sp. 10938]MEC3879135.1 hypothetical protein [Parapedobacter sp. 10938]
MKQVIHISTRKGSTGIHTAVPLQLSDGRSGGVPLRNNTPSLRKPTVLATMLPEPSQGTPGTAIGAELYHPGPALPRPQRGDGGADQVKAKGWKALVKRAKAKVTAWQAQIRRYYLARMRKHVALTTRRTFGFVRLIAFIIHISRRMLFRKTALPYGMLTQVVHDRRFALFRRRAVDKTFRLLAYNHICSHSSVWETAASSADDRLTKTFLNLKR